MEYNFKNMDYSVMPSFLVDARMVVVMTYLKKIAR